MGVRNSLTLISSMGHPAFVIMPSLYQGLTELGKPRLNEEEVFVQGMYITQGRGV